MHDHDSNRANPILALRSIGAVLLVDVYGNVVRCLPAHAADSLKVLVIDVVERLVEPQLSGGKASLAAPGACAGTGGGSGRTFEEQGTGAASAQ